MAKPISNEELGHLFGAFNRSAFRLEIFDRYDVPEEAMEYQRFIDGESFPSSTDDEWVAFIEKCVSQHKTVERVHIVTMPLTPYLRYEVEWGYLYSGVAGEKIYLLDRAHTPPDVLRFNDFWLFDGKILAIMRYDSAGRFLNAELEDSPEAIKIHTDTSVQLLQLAVPLKKFLSCIRTH